MDEKIDIKGRKIKKSRKKRFKKEKEFRLNLKMYLKSSKR